MQIKNGLVFTPDCTFVPMDLGVQEGKFSAQVDGDIIDATDCYVVPGFVDVHTHGAMNHDFSDGNPEGMQEISKFFASKGTTSFLSTTMTLSEEVLLEAVAVSADFTPKDDQSTCLGIHLEGPFITSAKKGAQAAEFVCVPDVPMFNRLQEAAKGTVRMISLAPENAGGLEFIQAVSDKCTISLGHTGANYEQATQAFQAGATHATHLYNAMNGIHHRDPNVIGAAFDNGAYAEMICDGIHIHPGVIRMTMAMFGDRFTMVSDSIRCTGLQDGEYTLGGQPVFVKDGISLMKDGTIAGSTVCLHDSLLRMASFGIALEDIIRAMTITPAKSIRMGDVAGVIAEGRQADCVILNKDLSIQQVILRGKPLL